MAPKITDADFQEKALKAGRVVLVDFWAEWCQPCKILGPIVEEFAQEYKDKMDIYEMNVDENPETPGQYNILSIPTLIFFKDGNPEKTMVGVHSKEQLKQAADELIG